MEADSLPGINYARLSRVTLSLGTPFHLTQILNLNHFLTIFRSVASIRDLISILISNFKNSTLKFVVFLKQTFSKQRAQI